MKNKLLNIQVLEHDRVFLGKINPYVFTIIELDFIVNRFIRLTILFFLGGVWHFSVKLNAQRQIYLHYAIVRKSRILLNSPIICVCVLMFMFVSNAFSFKIPVLRFVILRYFRFSSVFSRCSSYNLHVGYSFPGTQGTTDRILMYAQGLRYLFFPAVR